MLRSHECPVACWGVPLRNFLRGLIVKIASGLYLKRGESLKNAVHPVALALHPAIPPPPPKKMVPSFSLCRAASGAQRILKANGGIYGCISIFIDVRPSCVTCYIMPKLRQVRERQGRGEREHSHHSVSPGRRGIR